MFCDPNKRDLVYMMHSSSTPQHFLWYTSMTRHRRFGKKVRLSDLLKIVNNRRKLPLLTQISLQQIPTRFYQLNFEEYIDSRSEALCYLGPLYKHAFFRKLRWRTLIGNQ